MDKGECQNKRWCYTDSKRIILEFPGLGLPKLLAPKPELKIGTRPGAKLFPGGTGSWLDLRIICEAVDRAAHGTHFEKCGRSELN